MKYGFFDDEKREYVIETPFTPLPWINYLGSQEFFGLISIPEAVTASTVTQSCAVLHVSGTTAYRVIPAAGCFI